MTKQFLSKRRLTDREEAKVQRMIASDPDNPELTDHQIAKGKPFKKVFPELAASIKRSRGRPRVEAPKIAVTLRVHPDTVRRFQASGDGWRGDMAKALDAAGRRKKA